MGPTSVEDVRVLGVRLVNRDDLNLLKGFGMIVGVVDGFYGFEL
jgi:hypothetical protein